MTEQQITQAREDLEQLGIEQLRCGVMIQLLKIEALTKERDALQKQVDKLSSWEGGGVEVSLNAWKAAQADAARYRWLRRTATKLSFDNVLIGSLVRDQAELDGAIQEAGAQ
jgi:hypothetical protein